MAQQLTSADFRQSLTDHVAAKAYEAREKYGPFIDARALQRILQDKAFVRYPCSLRFSMEGLEPGECAHPIPLGQHPSDGFHMVVHPYFQSRPEAVTALVLYQLVLVNYGDFAGPEDAEAFGAGVLGMDRESYYHLMCDLADELCPPQAEAKGACGPGCGCAG